MLTEYSFRKRLKFNLRELRERIAPSIDIRVKCSWTFKRRMVKKRKKAQAMKVRI